MRRSILIEVFMVGYKCNTMMKRKLTKVIGALAFVVVGLTSCETPTNAYSWQKSGPMTNNGAFIPQKHVQTCTTCFGNSGREAILNLSGEVLVPAGGVCPRCNGKGYFSVY